MHFLMKEFQPFHFFSELRVQNSTSPNYEYRARSVRVLVKIVLRYSIHTVVLNGSTRGQERITNRACTESSATCCPARNIAFKPGSRETQSRFQRQCDMNILRPDSATFDGYWQLLTLVWSVSSDLWSVNRRVIRKKTSNVKRQMSQNLS